MNAMLQRHCARYIYVVPEGLRELMSDISREVLRSQPENTYAFIADYLDALMITRENARVAARLIQTISEIATTTVEFLQNTGMDRTEAARVVDIIQRTFKKHIEVQPTEIQPEGIEEANIISNIINEANISPEQAEEAAIIIQRAFRNFKLRRDKERELLSGMIDWRIAARSAIQLYRGTGVTNEEANRAATLIKAAYKGYYTRRVLRKLAAESKFLQEGIVEVEELGEEEEEHTGLRSVSINYETVVPHVDFDDETVSADALTGVGREKSTASVVVAYAIQGIIETAYPPEYDDIPEIAPDTVAQQEEQPIYEEPAVEIKEEPMEIMEDVEVAEDTEVPPVEFPEGGTEGPLVESAEEQPAQPPEDIKPAEEAESKETAPPAEEAKPADEVEQPSEKAAEQSAAAAVEESEHVPPEPIEEEPTA